MQNIASKQRRNNILNFANRISQNGNPYPTLTADHYSQLRLQELIIELTQKLQVTLEIEEMITLLLNQVHKLIAIDGISYEFTGLDYEYSTPVQGKHKASYQLDMGKEDLGLISFSRRTRFKKEELTSIENLMSCLLFPLRNGLKYRTAVHAASTDQLTGSGNRLALEKALTREINLAQRNDNPLSIIMFDFDNFKKVNDKFGHQGGDQVLKEVIQEIQRSIRKTDLLFRYGGEEFVLLMHKTSLDSAIVVADKVRAHIADTPIKYKQQLINVSVSMGASALQENDAISTLIDRADNALYQAKNLGRNCIFTAATT
jgi:diguanylate cyclase (GGDEF)-like protein